MTSFRTLEDIERLYAIRGGLHYGEGVTQIEHALQSAALAEAHGGPPSLIVAALLHDIGHLFENEDDVTESDARHETVGARILEGFFSDVVCRPVGLHVAAKRYLCFAEPQYWAALSVASRKSLELQGGPFNQAQALGFERTPYWQDAVLLRRFDDMGKRDENTGLSFTHYMPLMSSVFAKTD